MGGPGLPRKYTTSGRATNLGLVAGHGRYNVRLCSHLSLVGVSLVVVNLLVLVGNKLLENVKQARPGQSRTAYQVE